MPLGTNSHSAPIGNRIYGGGFNLKGDIFSQQTRLIIFCLQGCQISVQTVILFDLGEE
jgi:hypothetical protein